MLCSSCGHDRVAHCACGTSCTKCTCRGFTDGSASGVLCLCCRRDDGMTPEELADGTMALRCNHCYLLAARHAPQPGHFIRTRAGHGYRVDGADETAVWGTHEWPDGEKRPFRHAHDYWQRIIHWGSPGEVEAE